MHYLLTGGSGFIGSALCEALDRQGHQVTVLSRSVERARRRLPSTVQVIDVLPEQLTVDVIVNLAGEGIADGRWTQRRKQMLRESRLDTTRALITWIGRQHERPKRLISASAVGYYGPQDHQIMYENAVPGSDFAARLCMEWEARASEAEKFGVSVCLVRIGVVLGPGGALKRLALPFHFWLGGPLGAGTQWTSWIHIQDVVRLIGWLSHGEKYSGAWNCTSPNPVTNAVLASSIGKALKRPSWLPVPSWVLKMLLGEMSSILLDGQQALPARALEEGFTFSYPTLDNALKDLFKTS
jgi:uncharacterized protein (TIGR01777 family)